MDYQQIKAIQRVQDYIDNHLYKNITLHELANIAGYSPWHCAKLFKSYTGKSPYEYIRSLRLSEAALSLRDSDEKVINVALDHVFDSHEGFTRAFKKEFGITPSHYQKRKPPIYLYKSYPVEDLYHMQESLLTDTMKTKYQSFNIEVKAFPKRKLILKRGNYAKDYFEYMEDVGPEVWGLLCSIKEALYEPIGLWLPKKLVKENTSIYVHGVEVPNDYNGEIPIGFEMIDLEACHMMLFQGISFDDEEFNHAIDILSTIIDHYDPSMDGYQWDDQNAPRIQLEPQGYRGYIEARPVIKQS